MSELDVHRVICPIEHRQLLWHREREKQMQRTILALRSLLIEYDPTLPNAYDGTAWASIEDKAQSIR